MYIMPENSSGKEGGEKGGMYLSKGKEKVSEMSKAAKQKRAAVPALLFACLTAAGAAFGSGNLFSAANGIVCLALFLLLGINGAICGRETLRRWERCTCCSPPFRLFLPES